ncbi:MAG: hypothetical protein Q6K70_10850 [Thermostichales cyanobacterium DRC_bins_46]
MPSAYLSLPSQPVTGQVILAQQFNQDVMGDIGKGLTHFYESGQLWAALIGAAVGYIFKSVI